MNLLPGYVILSSIVQYCDTDRMRSAATPSRSPVFAQLDKKRANLTPSCLQERTCSDDIVELGLQRTRAAAHKCDLARHGGRDLGCLRNGRQDGGVGRRSSG